MGIATRFFFNASSSEEPTLHDRITPSALQMSEQQARWNALAEYVLPVLSTRLGYPTRSWLQGSYKFATQIRPVNRETEFDIDLGLYCIWKSSSEKQPPSAIEVKRTVQAILVEYERTCDEAEDVLEPPKHRCARISFAGSFHIDCPVYHLDPEFEERLLATEDDVWEVSDPKKLYIWFRDLFDDEARARVRRFCRYLKVWAALGFSSGEEAPNSTLLTVLATQAASGLRTPLPEEDDDLFCVLSQAVLASFPDTAFVPNPVQQENLASSYSMYGWRAIKDRLEVLVDVALRASNCKTEVAACSEWSQIFKHLIPLPSREAIESESKYLPAPRFNPQIEVEATSKDNPLLPFRGKNEIGPIPKDCEIRFQVTNTGIFPDNTRFEWTVRNHGFEASEVNDLGHMNDPGFTATEHSAYNGRHFMDCTAICNNRVIGVTRVVVDIYSANAASKRSV